MADQQLQESDCQFGPMSEAGVGLACLDCTFQTADESKADAHYALTGHLIAFDYIGHESDWPNLPQNPEVAS